jgi:hypothetical protein
MDRMWKYGAMIQWYHRGIIGRADAAASAGGLWMVYVAMQRDAAVWCVPALFAVAFCWIFDLSGPSSLWVSIPLVGITLFGCVFYVGTIYRRAIRRRTDVR